MANTFNNAGTPIWVAAGASTPVWTWNWGDNEGAQVAMANCLTPDGQMQTVGIGAELNEDGSVTYNATFYNEGPEPCFHNINGGGI